MDFSLPEELEMLRDMVRDFATEKIAPFADEWDEKHYFPYEEVVKPMGELGLFGTVIPEQYGGSEMGWLAAMSSPRKSPGHQAPCGCRLTCRPWDALTPSLPMAVMRSSRNIFPSWSVPSTWAPLP